MPIECRRHHRKSKNENRKANGYLTLWIALCGHLTDSDFMEYQSFLDGYLDRGEKISLFYDLRYVKWVPPRLIYALSHHMNESANKVKKCVNSSVILVEKDSFLKSIIRFLFSLRSPVRPNLVTDNLKNAWTFLDKNLIN